MMCTVRIVVDNQTRRGLAVEHGFAVLLDSHGEQLLLDTGAGAALMDNLASLGVELGSIKRLVLSHGHWDHTGGLAELLAALPDLPVFAAPGVLQERFSCHPERPVRDVSMPAECRRAYAAARVHELTGFTPICPGIFATGPIPRLSGEDCGGPFYLDAAKEQPDPLVDDQSLLLAAGVLIPGCCHSGIINTLEHCRRCAPGVKIHTIIGGLHLVHADQERLERTAAYLQQLGLRRLVACHCTGEEAIAWLRDRLSCEVLTGASGDLYEY
ncbi:MAG: MBL fold metallo-hydrolase [Lentisphaeria bacterium]